MKDKILSFMEEEIMNNVTNDFEVFMKESDGVGTAFMNSIVKMSEVSALDSKTHELAYISVLSALQMSMGLPYHVKQAKELGATLEEVKSAALVGMPLVGLRIAEAFATVINSYNSYI